MVQGQGGKLLFGGGQGGTVHRLGRGVLVDGGEVYPAFDVPAITNTADLAVLDVQHAAQFPHSEGDVLLAEDDGGLVGPAVCVFREPEIRP